MSSLKTDEELEISLEEDCIDIAASLGWFFCRKVTWVGRTSAPDRLFLKNGRHVWVEFKRPNRDANPSQGREHKRMRKHGAEVYVVDNREQFREILTKKS